MTGPFPGIDPYLEAQGYWRDFHNRFLTYLADQITDDLPDGYEARIDEQFGLFEATFEKPKLVGPDVAILRGADSSRSSAYPSSTLLMEPVTIPIAMTMVVEEKHTWIEIKRLPDRELVTVLELLSPTNKAGYGREDYLAKRIATLNQPVHLVELDFLLNGHRLPMAAPLPPGDFYALVTRRDRRPDCEVYAWAVGQPLPTIKLPLKHPDADLLLDLDAIFRMAYERGRYSRSIDYGRPPGLTASGDQADASQ